VSELADDAEQPGVDDLMQAIRAIKVDQFLITTVSTLASLAYSKLEEGELEQAKTAIEAIRALLPLVEPTLGPDAAPIRDALARLQLEYARVAAQPGEGAAEPAAPSGAQTGEGGADAPEPSAAEPGQPGPAQRSGRLWIPGQ